VDIVADSGMRSKAFRLLNFDYVYKPSSYGMHAKRHAWLAAIKSRAIQAAGQKQKELRKRSPAYSRSASRVQACSASGPSSMMCLCPWPE